MQQLMQQPQQWETLDLERASAVKKEVDALVANFDLLSQTQNPGIAQQIQSIQSRITELENFYALNCDDDRAILFEKQRLRLRKLVQTYGPSSGGSVHGSTGGISSNRGSRSGTPPHTPSASSSIGGSHRKQSGNASISKSIAASLSLQLPGAIQSSNTSMVHSTNNSSCVTPRTLQSHQRRNMPAMSITSAAAGVHAGDMVMATTTRSQRGVVNPPPSNKIYAWESSAIEKHTLAAPAEVSQRVAIEVDGVRYEPAAAEGFYNRRGRSRGKRDEMDIHDDEDEEEEDEQTRTGLNRFVDFQILLTAEELTTLAARRRADRKDVKLDKSQAASQSLLAALPYVEPRRVSQGLLRPDQPDKWINPAGIVLAYQKH